MGKTVLLVVDVQNALVEAGPYNREGFLQNLKALIAGARQQGVEVVYIQHADDPGEELEPGAPGWEICPEIAPVKGERVFEKRFNSAFKRTELPGYLRDRGVGRIILTGMKTEYCVDATCKSAFDLGYTLLIPKGSVTTHDNDWFTGEKLATYFEQKIWDGRFARVLPVEQVLEIMAEG